MRIAQIAPLYESVPPKGYGGTERVVSYLTEALVALGHDVTLFASADSKTSAKLVPCSPRALRTDARCEDSLSHHMLMFERVFQRADEFDVIHNHNDYLPYSLARRCATPVVTTLHGRLDMPDLYPLYLEFDDMPLVSISHSQRKPLPESSRWIGTVHHGLPRDLYRLGSGRGGYLAFLGRVSREKRVDVAIEVSKRTGIPLKVAAKIDTKDAEYYETIKHLFDHPLIEYVGEIGEREKNRFLGEAIALMFPIDWPEPFGLVMIEAMACGTPVIARRRGSVEEVMEHGVTGFICDKVDQMAAAVERAARLDRAACRAAFERRFSTRRMAENYVEIYERAIAEKKPWSCPKNQRTSSAKLTRMPASKADGSTFPLIRRSPTNASMS